MTSSLATGLTDGEVAQRVAEGKANDVPSRATRSVADIVRANVFTPINAILGVLFAIVLATGSVINGLFGVLIIANSFIGTVPLRTLVVNPMSRHCFSVLTGVDHGRRA